MLLLRLHPSAAVVTALDGVAIVLEIVRSVTFAAVFVLVKVTDVPLAAPVDQLDPKLPVKTPF